jgi:uncharacterized protein (DUF4213/DUF364 family)
MKLLKLKNLLKSVVLLVPTSTNYSLFHATVITEVCLIDIIDIKPIGGYQGAWGGA